MKLLAIPAIISLLAISSPIFAEGDAANGEKEFGKCKACHSIKNGDDVIVKGGKTGPNLFGVVGRAAGSQDFRYSPSMLSAGESGLIWDEGSIALFITDPKDYLREFTGDSNAKSKMTFKARKNQHDLAAYLARFSPEPAETGESTASTAEYSDS